MVCVCVCVSGFAYRYRSENVQLKSAVRELRRSLGNHTAVRMCTISSTVHSSHCLPQLQSVCSDLAQCMGCSSSVEGVTADSLRDILHTRTSTLLQDRQQALQQVSIACSISIKLLF